MNNISRSLIAASKYGEKIEQDRLEKINQSLLAQEKNEEKRKQLVSLLEERYVDIRSYSPIWDIVQTKNGQISTYEYAKFGSSYYNNSIYDPIYDTLRIFVVGSDLRFDPKKGSKNRFKIAIHEILRVVLKFRFIMYILNILFLVSTEIFAKWSVNHIEPYFLLPAMIFSLIYLVRRFGDFIIDDCGEIFSIIFSCFISPKETPPITLEEYFLQTSSDNVSVLEEKVRVSDSIIKSLEHHLKQIEEETKIVTN